MQALYKIPEHFNINKKHINEHNISHNTVDKT
jgi:hypothetical protein